MHSVSVHCMHVRDAMIHVELNTYGAFKDLHVYYTLYMINGEVWNKHYEFHYIKVVQLHPIVKRQNTDLVCLLLFDQ